MPIVTTPGIVKIFYKDRGSADGRLIVLHCGWTLGGQLG